MNVNFDKLFDRIKAEGLTQKEFMIQSNTSAPTLNRMRHNSNVNTESICKICDFFSCMPDEIMDWIPNEELMKAKREEKRSETERQIAELQAKLKEL